MIEEFISSKLVTARKKHDCDACVWISEAVDSCHSSNGEAEYTLNGNDVTKELATIKRNIEKGDKYIRSASKWDGSIATFKASTGCHAFCNKYELYQI